MRHRVTSDSGNAISLFPFLAVLLCTMGALLVLLVVLSQRAGERALAEATQAPIERVENAKFEQLTTDEKQAVAKLVSRLEELEKQHDSYTELRKQADERLRDEKDKLAHLEDHTRRIEHELAQLHIKAKQLEATENDQAVDQQRAEYELDRLEKLVAQKQEEVAELRENAKGKKSYAIVQYYGKDGTVVPRIYIECTGDAVTIQPEGTRFEREDFVARSWPGNPLAKVVRATQQHMREVARQSGAPLVEPLPLLIVRPSGTGAMEYARAALESAEIGYGFDYVGGENSISYPTGLDPKLAQTQHQAQSHARIGLVAHMEAAPRRYRRELSAYAAEMGLPVGRPNQAKQALFARLRGSVGGGRGAGGTGADGQQARRGSPHSQSQEDSDVPRYGDYAGGSETSSDAAGMSTDGSPQDETGTGFAGEQQYGSMGQAFGAGGAQAADASAASSSTASATTSTGGTPSPADPGGLNSNFSTPSGQRITPNISANFEDRKEQRTQNLSEDLNPQRSRGSVPIQRPVQIVVRADQFALVPSRHDSDRSSGAVISMKQSSKRIGEDLVASLRSHMEDWGIAGRGLYWKPVLHLKVGPDGRQSALRLAKMLANSGIEVRLPDEFRLSRGDESNATR